MIPYLLNLKYQQPSMPRKIYDSSQHSHLQQQKAFL